MNRINKIFSSLFLGSIIQVIPKNFVSGWKEQEEFLMSFHYPKSGISSISPYCIHCTLIYIIVYLSSWVWVNSGRLWRTWKPGVLQSMGVTKSWTWLSHWIEVSQKEKTKYHILMNYMESIKMVPTTDEPICREAMET